MNRFCDHSPAPKTTRTKTPKKVLSRKQNGSFLTQFFYFNASVFLVRSAAKQHFFIQTRVFLQRGLHFHSLEKNRQEPFCSQTAFLEKAVAVPNSFLMANSVEKPRFSCLFFLGSVLRTKMEPRWSQNEAKIAIEFE